MKDQFAFAKTRSAQPDTPMPMLSWMYVIHPPFVSFAAPSSISMNQMWCLKPKEMAKALTIQAKAKARAKAKAKDTDRNHLDPEAEPNSRMPMNHTHPFQAQNPLP